ncbi:MAG: carbohydrate-binding domain-containing protein [Agathobacter sp.]|nr:carbohydrate-binding domain-containing protein [Agathobacter sp.]
MKKRCFCAICFCMLLILTGCNDTNKNQSTESSESENTEKESVLNEEEIFSQRDYETEYNVEDCAYIRLNGDSATSDSNAVEIVDGVITIIDEGTYIVSGTLEDGMIIVDSEDTDKTQIVLDGVEINSKTSAAIYVKQSDKVFITLADGSENILSNGGSFENIDDNNIDGVIFSKSDLTLNGAGALTITSPGGHGIVSKDDLKITGGSYEITTASHGLSANDLIAVASGNIMITSEEDGMNSELHVYIAGGIYQIASGDDAIHADETLSIADGEINITESYEGLEGLDIIISGGDIALVASDDGLNAAGGNDQSGYGGSGNDQFGGHGGGPGGGRGGMPGGFGGMNASSNGSILIEGGTLYIKASGDGIDANGTLEITGGEVIVCGPTQGDTATLDYDTSAVISGGTFIGTGAINMAQTFSDSEQGVIAVSVGNQQAGTEIKLIDSNGNEIISHTPELSFAVVILSSEDIRKGDTYTIQIGTISGEFEAE